MGLSCRLVSSTDRCLNAVVCSFEGHFLVEMALKRMWGLCSPTVNMVNELCVELQFR